MFKDPPEAKGQSPVKPDNPTSRVQPVVRAPRAPRLASRMCRELVAVQARPALRLVSPMFKAPAAAPVRRAPRPASPMFRVRAAAWVPWATRPAFRTCRVPVAAWVPWAPRLAFRTCRARAEARAPWEPRPAFRTCRVPAAARAPRAPRPESRMCRARAARRGRPAPKPAPRRRPPAAEGVAQVERLERSPTPAAVRLPAPRVCLERSSRWSASRSCGPRRFCGDSFGSDRCEAETAGRKPGGFLLLGRSRQISPLQLSGYIYRMLTELGRRV